MKVFLGGTCNGSEWREQIMPQLMCNYFNPVVEDWTPECQAIEEQEKVICDYHLYVITPKMKGVFSIAEVVNDSMKLKDKCIFCVTKEEDDDDFQQHELKSLKATEKLITNNGGTVLSTLGEVVAFLNELSTKISRDNRLKPFLLNYGYKHNDIDIYKNVWMIYDEMYTDFIDVHYFGKHIEEKKGHDKYVALDNKFRKERRNSFLLVEYNSGDGNFETKCRNVTGFYTRDGWSNTFEFLDKLYKQLYTYNGYYGCFTSEINQICNFLKTINNLPCRI